MRNYKTIQGDTWDLIAYKNYPDFKGELLMSVLMEYNPEFIDTVIFSAGQQLLLPDLELPVSDSLPPWLR